VRSVQPRAQVASPGAGMAIAIVSHDRDQTMHGWTPALPFLELVGAIYPPLLKRMVDDGLASGNECIAQSTVINYDITGYG